MSHVEVRVRGNGPGGVNAATLRVYLSNGYHVGAPKAGPRVNVEVIDAAPIDPNTHGRHEVIFDLECWRALNRAVEALAKDSNDVPF